MRAPPSACRTSPPQGGRLAVILISPMPLQICAVMNCQSPPLRGRCPAEGGLAPCCHFAGHRPLSRMPHAEKACRRPVRRLVQSAACRPCAGRRDRAQAAGARPAVVDGHAGQSAEEHARTGAARRAAAAFGEHRPKTRTSRSPPSRPRIMSASPPTRWRWSRRAIPASISSGSWAPTVCATSTAGSAGGRSS